MIAEVVFIAILVSASIDARIVDSSKLTPDTLAASWSRSGRMPRAPPNLNSTSLQEALNDALSTLATDSFHVRKIAQTSLNGAKLPHVDNLHAMIRLVKHIVECALDDHQMVTIQTSEGKRLQFEGLIGLAPQWIRRAIDKDAQESVSACLAARATIFKTPPISLRGSALAVYADEKEEELYSSLEGLFWGNMFAEDDAALMSCWSPETAVAWRQARVCATGDPVSIGHLTCGMMRHLGPCKRICRGGPESDEPWSIRSCEGNIHVVAVYLRNDASAKSFTDLQTPSKKY